LKQAVKVSYTTKKFNTIMSYLNTVTPSFLDESHHKIKTNLKIKYFFPMLILLNEGQLLYNPLLFLHAALNDLA
jgi:hypothetical protein